VPLCSVSLDDLTILDEADFAHVAAYAQLKRALRAVGCQFRVPAPPGTSMSWDCAVKHRDALPLNTPRAHVRVNSEQWLPQRRRR
jgi:hypothetical protein